MSDAGTAGEVITLRARDGRLHGPGVTISLSAHAPVCEAPRCPEDSELVRVDLADYGTEVVCPAHADDLLERERGWS